MLDPSTRAPRAHAPGHRFIAPLSFLLAAMGTLGCLAPGKYNRLKFVYRTEDTLFLRTSVRSPIALGSEVDLEVFGPAPAASTAGEASNDGPVAIRAPVKATGPFQPIDVDSARSDRPEVIEVGVLQRSTARLRARSPGQAEVAVTTRRGDDALDLQVAEVDRAEVEHWVRALVLKDRFTAEAAFVKGSAGRFLLTTHDAQGRALVGYGTPIPLLASPAGAARITSPIGAVAQVEVRFDQVGPVSLQPKGGAALEVAVIDRAMIQALELQQITPKGGLTPFTTGKVKDAIGLVIRGTLADGPAKVLLGGGGAIVSRTPATCAALPDDEHRLLEGRLGDGVYGITLLAPGTCTIEASLFGKTARGEIVVEVGGAAP